MTDLRFLFLNAQALFLVWFYYSVFCFGLWLVCVIPSAAAVLSVSLRCSLLWQQMKLAAESLKE